MDTTQRLKNLLIEIEATQELSGNVNALTYEALLVLMADIVKTSKDIAEDILEQTERKVA